MKKSLPSLDKVRETIENPDLQMKSKGPDAFYIKKFKEGTVLVYAHENEVKDFGWMEK